MDPTKDASITPCTSHHSKTSDLTEANKTLGVLTATKRPTHSIKRTQSMITAVPMNRNTPENVMARVAARGRRSSLSSLSLLERLETELAFLRDEYKTICIMIDSLRNAYIPLEQRHVSSVPQSDKGSGTSSRSDVDKEMRTAFDDLNIQVHQLEKKVVSLEQQIQQCTLNQAKGFSHSSASSTDWLSSQPPTSLA